jgi:hypothetical protein
MAKTSTRVREDELVVPALRHLNAAPSGFLETSDLIAKLEAEFAPDGEDAEILDGRHDTRFSQKVRNLVSHRNTSTSMSSLGYATYDSKRRGWTITPAGRARV